MNFLHGDGDASADFGGNGFRGPCLDAGVAFATGLFGGADVGVVLGEEHCDVCAILLSRSPLMLFLTKMASIQHALVLMMKNNIRHKYK